MLPLLGLFAWRNLEESGWIWRNLWESEQWFSASNSEIRLKTKPAERPLCHETFSSCPFLGSCEQHRQWILCCLFHHQKSLKFHKLLKNLYLPLLHGTVRLCACMVLLVVSSWTAKGENKTYIFTLKAWQGAAWLLICYYCLCLVSDRRCGMGTSFMAFNLTTLSFIKAHLHDVWNN